MSTSVAKQQQLIHQKVVRETLARIAKHEGVLGYAVVNPRDGRIFEFAGFQNNKVMAEDFVDTLMSFLSVTQSMVRIIDRDDELTFLRMRWRHREIIIAPDKEYALIVVQDKVDDGSKDPGRVLSNLAATAAALKDVDSHAATATAAATAQASAGAPAAAAPAPEAK